MISQEDIDAFKEITDLTNEADAIINDDPYIITAEIFEAAVGYKPEQDDLERCNCKQAGEIGHWCCGWNQEHNKPQYMLGPVYKPKLKPANYYSLD